MAVVWTKLWGPADDGTILRGVDLANIQNDINATGLADADKIQGFPVTAPTPADDGKALVYDDSAAEFVYASLSGIEPGMMQVFAGAVAPAGWELCYGQAISRVTFSTLFANIGTTYGIGDGATTFNLPDLRGRFPLGADNMGVVSANRVTATQADNIGQSDGIELRTPTGTTDAISTALIQVDDNSGGTDYIINNPTGHTHTFTANAINIMNPYLTMNWIIKTT